MKRRGWIFIILVILLALSIIVIKNIQNKNTDLNCEDTLFTELWLEPFDHEYLNNIVMDYYVDEKEVAYFYWDKLCRDLLDMRLVEELNKSENIWLDSRGWFREDYFELQCNYNLFWGEEGDFYGQEIEKGKEIFSTEEVLLAQENRPLKYNSSLITIDVLNWSSHNETLIKNSNPDYAIKLRLKLNESIRECY